jgi:FAD synthase
LQRKSLKEISPAPMNVRLPDQEKFEITAKRLAIGSFGPFHIGHTSAPATSKEQDSQDMFDTRDLQANLITGAPC